MTETFLERAVAHLQKATETSDWAELTAKEARALAARLAALERVADAAREVAAVPRQPAAGWLLFIERMPALRDAIADLDGSGND